MKTLEELTGFWLEQVACEEGKIIASVFSHGTESCSQEWPAVQICCCPHCHATEALEADKPPIGLLPRRLLVENRMGEILAAMRRYVDSSKQIPAAWVRELEERIVELRDDAKP